VQPPGEAERATQGRARHGRPRARRDHAGTDVAPGAEHEGRDGQHERGCREQPEHPPALVAEGAGLLPPADRRQPRGPGADGDRAGGVDVGQRVAHGAQQERRPDGGSGDAVGAACGADDLGRDAGDAREHETDPEQRRTDEQRPADLEVERDEDEGDAGADPERRHAGDLQRGAEAGVTADRRGTEQLGTASLLVGACVAYDGLAAEQRGEDGQEPVPLHDHERAELGAGRGAVEDAHDGVGGGEGGGGHAFLGAGVQPDEAAGHRGHHPGDDDDPHRDHDAVTAQAQPHEAGESGQAAHDAPPLGTATSSWTSSAAWRS
jgi:hypothetical protein